MSSCLPGWRNSDDTSSGALATGSLPRFGRCADCSTSGGLVDCEAHSGADKRGEMSEGLKEHAWKACVGVILLPWVRIPLSPPLHPRRVPVALPQVARGHVRFDGGGWWRVYGCGSRCCLTARRNRCGTDYRREGLDVAPRLQDDAVEPDASPLVARVFSLNDPEDIRRPQSGSPAGWRRR